MTTWALVILILVGIVTTDLIEKIGVNKIGSQTQTEIKKCQG